MHYFADSVTFPHVHINEHIRTSMYQDGQVYKSRVEREGNPPQVMSYDECVSLPMANGSTEARLAASPCHTLMALVLESVSFGYQELNSDRAQESRRISVRALDEGCCGFDRDFLIRLNRSLSH
jgi:hypothetical protein